MTERRFGDWLASTVELQRAFGTELRGMRHVPHALAEYLTWNFAALFEELGEMMHEIRWAPWKTARGVLTDQARDRAVDEAIDVLHFLGNVLSALGVSDEELSDRYVAKQTINRSRLESGRSKKTGDDFEEPATRVVELKRRTVHYPECPWFGRHTQDSPVGPTNHRHPDSKKVVLEACICSRLVRE